ncbi:MAG: TolC family protein, partial [Odoribacter sp.]|nr:TolC family protein [Odoribacter sp.]
MNVKIPIRQSLSILLSICCSVAPKMNKAQSGWTEDECMQYAIRHNLRIRNKQLDTKIANVDIVTAYGNFLPSINTIGTLGRQFGHSIDPRTNQYTSESFWESTMNLNISLPIFEGFSRFHKLQFYKLNKRINALLSKVEENNLAFAVLEAFYRHCFDKEMHQLATEQRKLSEYYCEQMIAYVDLGLRSHADLQEVKARLQSDIYQETMKSNSSQLSLLTLKELMNMKDTDTLSVVMADPKMDASYPLSLNELCSTSESTLSEFQVMEMKEKASRKSLSVANGSFYPSIRMEFNLNTGYYDTEKNKFGTPIPFREQLTNN